MMVMMLIMMLLLLVMMTVMMIMMMTMILLFGTRSLAAYLKKFVGNPTSVPHSGEASSLDKCMLGASLLVKQHLGG